jgi:glycosyltransferase involved in cell wall biosynthesis
MTAAGSAQAVRKVRLLCIVPQLATGGAELQLAFFCRNRDRERFDVSVLYYEPAHDLAPVLSDLGVHVKYLDREKLGVLGLLRAIRREIRSRKPDVIECRLPSAYRFGRLAALGAGAPVVIAQERTARRDLWRRRLVDRLCNLWTDAWIGNSQAVAEHLVRDIGARRDRVHVIYNGIDIAAFSTTERHPLLARLRDQGKRVVLNLGRLDLAKNQVLFLQVCDRLRRQFDDLAFAICGEGEHRRMLESRCRDLGLENDCHFLGLQKNVPAVLAAADLLIQTSDIEGLPNAIIEGMAAGLPIVATDAGGTRELIDDGETGLVVPVGDREAVVAGAARLLMDAPLACRLGAAAAEQVRKRFTVEISVRAFEALVERLLCRKGADPAIACGAGSHAVSPDGKTG